MAEQEAKHGWFWVPAILLWAILVAALPMLVGIAVVGLLPWFGGLRVAPWTVLLHVLWMYPATWIFGLVVEP